MWNGISARYLVLSGDVCAYCIDILMWMIILKNQDIIPDLGEPKVYMVDMQQK
jgi:hypothetical protein